MRKTKFFRGELIYRSRADIELEQKLLKERTMKEEEESGPLREYIRNNFKPSIGFITEFSFIEYKSMEFYTEKCLNDVHNLRPKLFNLCLQDLAKQAIEEKCDYVVNVRPFAYNGMTSKAASGFVIGVGGTGFGIASPDGVYSAYMALMATGVKRK